MSATLIPGTPDWGAHVRSFDAGADAYEAHRPGYPAELVAAVVEAAGLTPGSRVLEIGSGTGKATASFAPLGCSILCLEPGKNLAAIAARKLAGNPHVRILTSRLEDADLPASHFDLAMSAQAFHWVNADIGLAKIADALKPGGRLALFWNRYPGMTGALAEEIQQAYAAHGLEARPASAFDVKVETQTRQCEGWIAKSGRFRDARILRFPWLQSYTTAQYLGLLGTYSDHAVLSPPLRERLLAAIGEVIDRHGGTIDRPYLAVLHLARR